MVVDGGSSTSIETGEGVGSPKIAGVGAQAANFVSVYLNEGFYSVDLVCV